MTTRKERKMARFQRHAQTGSILMGALVAALVSAFPLSAATDSTFIDSASATKAATSASETQAKDKQRMTTHVGDPQPIAFQDIRPFPEPARAAEISKPKSNKSLYWIGATGIALATGVAAYFIFSGEPEREQPAYVVLQ